MIEWADECKQTKTESEGKVLANRVFTTSSIFYVLILLAGCTSTWWNTPMFERFAEPADKIHMTTLANTRSNNWGLVVESFGPGETPVVVITGYFNQTVTLKFYEITSAEAFDSYTKYISERTEETVNTITRKDPWPPGTYQVVLLLHGIQASVATFTVHG